MAGKITLLPFVISFILVSCSSGGLSDRQGARNFLQEGKYAEAIGAIKNSDEYKKERTRLLLSLEEGLILHAQGQYVESISALDDAKKIAQDLFTVSISKKAEKTFLSEAMDDYYGEAYEKSLIQFYLALNHYLLYQTSIDEKNSRNELFQARAEIVQWDSFLNTLRSDRAGDSVFKNDLLAKTFGAMIHEAIDTRADDQIALQLYKDAHDVLFKNYNSYKSFNLSAASFKKDYSKLPEMSLEDVKKNYIAETAYQKQLKEFLDYKIVLLTKMLRPSELATTIKHFDIPDSIVKKMPQKLKKHNVSLVVEKGLIPLKKPEKYYFSLDKGSQDSEGAKALASIGSMALTLFAAEKLGLMPAPNNWNPSAAYIGLNVAAFAVNNIAISFELPTLEAKTSSGDLTLEIYNDKNEKIREESLFLVNPLGDIAQEAIAEHAAWLYSRIGVRLASKHLMAIAASFATYRALGGGAKDGDFFAKNAAVIQYVGASKLIEQSEKADTRYWSTLPQDIRLNDFFLPVGTYHFKLRSSETAPNSNSDYYYDLGQVEIKSESKKVFINFRTKV